MAKGGAAMTARAGQLVRLLGSDRDGEVLNACRALGRVLRAAGRDWHWLGDLAEKHIALPAAAARPWQALAADLLRRGAGSLTEREAQFLNSMVTWRRQPTPK